MTKPRLVAYLLVSAFSLALLLPAAAFAAQNVFLRIDGIPGESVDDRHKDAIDVLSFSWGVSAGKDRAQFQDFSFTKRVDQASPQLVLRAAGGQAIPVAVLTMRSAGERQDDFLKYCLTDVRVTSVSTAGSTGEDRPTEQVSLSYGTFYESYRKQGAGGSLGTAFTGGWDLSNNVLLGAVPPTC